ncbi:MAG: class I SAM-dependent methyltransferase [Thermoplasmata archaeon]|nr:class I SAM-dependent methyltransferase [Thermoplasmata archaeon]
MNIFDNLYNRYDTWFERHENVYKSELNLLKHFSSGLKNGIEIGVGTGRFSSVIKTEYGIDPSIEMLKIAKSRGINVILARGENIPIRDEIFSYITIIVTLCFVDDPEQVIKESKRILNKKGHIFIGYIEKESKYGKYYASIESPFYKNAIFFSFSQIKEMLESLNFKIINVSQTLFHGPGYEKLEPWSIGHDKGSFILIHALMDDQ